MAAIGGSPSPFQRFNPQATPIVPANGIDVELPPEAPADRDIAVQPDGTVVVNLNPQSLAAAPGEFLAAPHNTNLAELLPEEVLADIGESLAQAIAEDLKSREQWEYTLANGLKYLGIEIEERTKPFKGASGIYDSTMMTANVRFQATAFKELQPAGGPVKTEVIGAVTLDNMLRSERVKNFMNYYLTREAEEYRPEFRQMLWWVGLEGCAFKKIYRDDVLARPVSPMIRAEDIIVPYGTTDLFSAPRITHRFPISERELKKAQLAGKYRMVTLAEPIDPASNPGVLKQAQNQATGTRPTKGEIDKSYVLYESHAYIDIEGLQHCEPNDETGELEATGLPLPYRVTLDRETHKVLGIYRNWNESDPSFVRKMWFVCYPFIPGMGFYGLGFAHLLGNIARGATALRRQITDAATLAMMPSGMRAKGARFADNNVAVQPLEFPEVDTGGQPISNFILPFSFKGPDQASIALLQETYKQGEQLASTTEIAIGEGRQDAPVGTIMALLEASTRIESSIVAGLHDALRLELQMLAELFHEGLPPKTPYRFATAGGQGFIVAQDFGPHVDVQPVSDPNIASSTQRLVRAQFLQQATLQAPQIHDQRVAYQILYSEMGYDQKLLNALLPPPQQTQPLDPLSENMAILQGKPAKAGPAQNHDAHIAVHQAVMGLPNGAAHVQEHLALKMRMQVAMVLAQQGVQLPPPGTPLPPQIENQIAVLTAQAMQQLQAQAAAAAAQMPGGPQQQADIAEKALQTEALAVQQKANAAEIAAQTEMVKAQIQSADKAADRAAKENIARIRAGAQEQIHGIQPDIPGGQ